MRLSYQQVKHIAWLARLSLSDEEVERFSLQLSNILENFEILKEVDTSNVPPASHLVPLYNVLRKDMVTESYPRAEILANAPRQAEDCFQVQPILE